MSQENVERMHQSFDAFARRGKAGWSELCDPALEAVPVGEWPEKQVRGRDSVWDFLIATDEPWEPGDYEAAEVSEGQDMVAVQMRRNFRGRASGVEVDYDYWAVFTFRDGKIVRTEWFEGRADALEAAGLSE